MGGGASRAKRRKDNKAESGAASELTKAVKRRRRVLFGTASPQPFELVSPLDQFTHFPESNTIAVVCDGCGSRFVDDSPFCRKCSQKRPVVATYERCSCGNEFVADVGFCRKCGIKRPAALDNDLVFDRVGIPIANEFRNHAHRFCNVDGFLGPHAIELLGLEIGSGSFLNNKSGLAGRLFRLGQVGRPLIHIKQSASGGPEDSQPLVEDQETTHPRPDNDNWLTCYELLALYSVIRKGSKQELLELLFCVFDVDEDDLVSLEDFQTTIVNYLELQDVGAAAAAGTVAGLEGTELDEYRKVDNREKTLAARRLAELAVSKYGAGVELAPPDEGEETKVEEPHKEEKKAEEKPKAKPAPKKKGGFGLCKGKQPASDSEDDKKAKDAKDAKNEKKDGKRDDKDDKKDAAKPLLDENSDSEGSWAADSDEAAQMKKKEKKVKEGAADPAAPKKKSRWSAFSPRRSKQNLGDDKKGDDSKKDGTKAKGADAKEECNHPDAESSADTAGAGADAKDGKEAQGSKATPKGKAKAAAKKQGGGCCLCGGSKKKPPAKKPMPPLNFEQWSKWFDDNFSEFVVPDSHSSDPAMGSKPGGSQDISAIRTLPPPAAAPLAPKVPPGNAPGGARREDDDVSVPDSNSSRGHPGVQRALMT